MVVVHLVKPHILQYLRIWIQFPGPHLQRESFPTEGKLHSIHSGDAGLQVFLSPSLSSPV